MSGGRDSRSPAGGRTAWITLTIVALVVIVVAGYIIPWAWTGFTGNRLWDWLHLMLLPLLVPVVLVPILKPGAMARMGIVEEEAPAPPSAATSEAEPAPGPPQVPQG